MLLTISIKKLSFFFIWFIFITTSSTIHLVQGVQLQRKSTTTRMTTSTTANGSAMGRTGRLLMNLFLFLNLNMTMTTPNGEVQLQGDNCNTMTDTIPNEWKFKVFTNDDGKNQKKVITSVGANNFTQEQINVIEESALMPPPASLDPKKHRVKPSQIHSIGGSLMDEWTEYLRICQCCSFYGGEVLPRPILYRG